MVLLRFYVVSVVPGVVLDGSNLILCGSGFVLGGCGMILFDSGVVLGLFWGDSVVVLIWFWPVL